MDRHTRYNRSPKGHARAIRYNKTARGRARTFAYNQGAKRKAVQRRYRSKPEVLAHKALQLRSLRSKWRIRAEAL